MSALAEAIRRGEPRRDLGGDSPFAGLRRGHARTMDVVAQSIAATAPAGVLLVHPGALFGRSGSFAFLDIVLTIGLVVAVALVIGMFSRRISSTGSLYTFTTRGLGPWAGILGGSALAIGYLAIAMNTLVSGASRIAGLLTTEGDAAPGVTVAVMAVTAVVAAAVIARGLRMSTRILLVLEIVAVATVLMISLAALSFTRWDLALLVPQPAHFSPDVIMTGVAFALIGFVGFESGAALGPESRWPFAAVPRGILVSVGATGGVLLLGTAAQLALVADGEAEGPLEGAVGLGWLIDLIVAVSFLACSLAMTNAATRLAFALSREGVIPAVFGHVSRRGVPAAGGLLITLGVFAAPALVLLLGGTRQDLRTITSPAGTVGFLLAYALVCAAAPVFLARIAELTKGALALSVGAALALLAVLGFALVSTASANPFGLAWVAVILCAVALSGMLRLRRRSVLDRVGVHDWPVAADTIGGAGERSR